MTPEQQGKVAAEEFRARHNLGSRALHDLVFIIEQTTEHEVAVLDVEDADEHGLTMWDPKRRVAFMGVARTRNLMRQRSTLAHELAHVVFADWSNGSSEELSARTPQEIRADAFARHLLIPAKGLVNLLGEPGAKLTEADLSAVVQQFLVSPAVAAIALCNGGYIPSSTKDAWMKMTTRMLATRFGWSDQYRMLQHDADQTRVPQRLLSRAITGYKAGIIPVQAIAVLRGVPEEEVVADLEEAGIVAENADARWMDSDELPSVDINLADLDDILGPESLDHKGSDAG